MPFFSPGHLIYQRCHPGTTVKSHADRPNDGQIPLLKRIESLPSPNPSSLIYSRIFSALFSRCLSRPFFSPSLYPARSFFKLERCLSCPTRACSRASEPIARPAKNKQKKSHLELVVSLGFSTPNSTTTCFLDLLSRLFLLAPV